jgi:hypothetical protein
MNVASTVTEGIEAGVNVVSAGTEAAEAGSIASVSAATEAAEAAASTSLRLVLVLYLLPHSWHCLPQSY